MQNINPVYFSMFYVSFFYLNKFIRFWLITCQFLLLHYSWFMISFPLILFIENQTSILVTLCWFFLRNLMLLDYLLLSYAANRGTRSEYICSHDSQNFLHFILQDRKYLLHSPPRQAALLVSCAINNNCGKPTCECTSRESCGNTLIIREIFLKIRTQMWMTMPVK